ncbi:MAG TPA: hypothetical protein VGG78_07145 [Gemmatimonadaceae bacterium]|jgi:hypothetical protein
MSQTSQSPDLSPLAADYEIVGELDAPNGPRSYIGRRKAGPGKRRDDQTGVLISIVTPPEGDEANALTLLAADTQVLSRLTHRRLIPVLEGRWIGDDVYAVVTQRVNDPSLAQRLAAGETFTNPRIAAILREVNGLLEWARGQKIVHRNVTPDRVFLEPKTDRVRVSFGIAPLRRIRHSDVDDDARTIARLAVAMLTGNADQRAEDESLADQRPDLPVRLLEATASLLDEKTPGTPADVAAYLALIGMADPLAEGETERDRIRAEILEEQRLEREKLASERASFEQEMATKHAEFEREMALEREKLAGERTELERAATAEREELRRALANERAQLTAKREELERTVAAQKAAMERAAAEDRRRIADLRAAIQRAGEIEVEKKRQAALEDIADQDTRLDEDDLATPLFVPPMISPLEELEFDDATPVMRDEPIVFAPVHEEPPRNVEEEREVAPMVAGDEVDAATPRGAGTWNRRRWTLAGVAAAVVVLIGGSAIAIANRRTPTEAVARPVATTPIAVAPASAVPPSIVPMPTARTVLDSSAGGIAQPSDSLARTAARRSGSDTSKARASAAAAEARRPKFVDPDSAVARRAALAARESTTNRDSANRRRAMSLSDSLFNFREPTPSKRDSVTRPDTTNP